MLMELYCDSIILCMSGRIDISKLNNPPEKHELRAAQYFAERGYDIEFIPTSNIPEIHTPDILMDGKEWEIKSPIGKSKRTIEKNLLLALKQSQNIIMDLRRINISEAQCISKIEFNFKHKGSIKRLLVIRKNGELLRYER